jgi:hypothetical protein
MDYILKYSDMIFNKISKIKVIEIFERTYVDI